MFSSGGVVRDILVLDSKDQFCDVLSLEDKKLMKYISYLSFLLSVSGGIQIERCCFMLAAGRAIFVGYRSGEKNGRKWMNVFLDDPDNPLQRLQVFVPQDLIPVVEGLPQSSHVKAQLRVYMRQTDNYPAPAISLIAIQLDRDVK